MLAPNATMTVTPEMQEAALHVAYCYHRWNPANNARKRDIAQAIIEGRNLDGSGTAWALREAPAERSKREDFLRAIVELTKETAKANSDPAASSGGASIQLKMDIAESLESQMNMLIAQTAQNHNFKSPEDGEYLRIDQRCIG